jgi:hypothetical protein
MKLEEIGSVQTEKEVTHFSGLKAPAAEKGKQDQIVQIMKGELKTYPD